MPASNVAVRVLEKFPSMASADGSMLTVPCQEFYRGFTMRDTLYCRVPDGFSVVEDWSNGYREVWINSKDRAIFTLCEGDLDMTVDADAETFERRVESAREFYANA